MRHARRAFHGCSLLTAALGISLALGLDPARAWAQDARPFPTSANSFVRGIFLDGDTLAVGGSTASIAWRDGTVVGLPTSGGTQALCGRRVGDGLVIAHASFSGVARSDGANVTTGSAPTMSSDRITSCAVDASGSVYFVGERRAAYRWSGNSWTVLEFNGAITGETVGAAVGPEGTLYVLSTAGLARLVEERFEPVPVPELGQRTVTSGALWVSERTGRVHIAWDHAVVVFDPQTGRSTVHRHDLFGSSRAITGVSTPSGELIAVAAQSSIAVFDGQQFWTSPREFVFTRGLAFDPRGRALYVGAQPEVGAIAIGHPWLAAQGAAAPAPVERPAVVGPSPVNSSESTERMAVTPAGGGASSVTPSDAGSSSIPRSTRYSYFPVARFGFGAALGPGARSSLEGGFAFDFTAGLLAYRDRPTVQFMPELGVSYQGGPTPGGTYFTAGLSALYGSQLFSGGLAMRGMMGGSSAGFAGGVRSGLVFQALFTSFSLDLGYQYLPTAVDNRHAFVATVSVNPVPLIAGLFILDTLFRLGR